MLSHLTSLISNDMLIKLWNWENSGIVLKFFEGHTHYIMQIVFNPKDNNTFASASLDRTVKVWQLDKPYLISGADDRLVKIWDYQNKTCIHTLEGHAQNISAVTFHPEFPIIMTGSEDGTVRVWHANTYRLESTLNYNLERVWTIACLKGSNNVALGYDEGSIIIKVGREEPAMSMDSSGKIIWAKHSELQQANLKAMSGDIKDGERLPLIVKDMGSCEIYPQTISHNPNGRFVVVCGDGEYIIYTAMALRNKSFGSAQEFVWALDSSEYAVRESSTCVKIFKNFKEKKTFKPEYGAEAIFGGHMLGIRSISGLAFHDWETLDLIRRIEIQPKHVFWSESGELVCIATNDAFYILRYNSEVMIKAKHFKTPIPEDGIEQTFEVIGMHMEIVKTGLWVGDCFIYTNSVNRLNYYVGGEIVTISHLDRDMYLLGYIPKDNRLYLGVKDLDVVGSLFEKQGYKSQALMVSTDLDHKFELSLQLEDLSISYGLAKSINNEQKWKQLAELAMKKCEFKLAEECLHYAKDFGGLLLLATSSGNASIVEKLGQSSEAGGINNVAFLSYFLLGKKEKALNMLVQTGVYQKQLFLLVHTYLAKYPVMNSCSENREREKKRNSLGRFHIFQFRLSQNKPKKQIVKLWKENFKKVNEKAALALADPEEYENLFPGFNAAVKTEQFLRQNQARQPAASYKKATANYERDPIKEMLEAEENGKFDYIPDDDTTGSQNSLSESGGDVNSLSEHFASSFKTVSVEAAPIGNYTNAKEGTNKKTL
ncbi:coatomer subunit beta' [Caerostris extrusa]|uniref:Beta'-coat protein n=1 Tax=Caerostris extrusa TaxID=172846 RepID=A0AAV4N4X5_CAEEX|nr:coatomer subunit beta' [Caerostris extrusa]